MPTLDLRRNRTFPRRLFCLSTALVLIASCAGLHPPVASHPAGEATLELTPHRADPDGLALTLYARDATPGDELELWRRDEGGDWSLAEALDVNEPLADALSTGRVEWRDPLGDHPRSLQYRMRLRGEVSDASDPVDIHWPGALETPSPEAAKVNDSPLAIRLRWNVDALREAHILRRDVLHEDAYTALAVVDPAAGGVFEDDDVDPGGVYSYRIQLVDRLGPFPRYGPLSESLYVSLPD